MAPGKVRAEMGHRGEGVALDPLSRRVLARHDGAEVVHVEADGRGGRGRGWGVGIGRVVGSRRRRRQEIDAVDVRRGLPVDPSVVLVTRQGGLEDNATVAALIGTRGIRVMLLGGDYDWALRASGERPRMDRRSQSGIWSSRSSSGRSKKARQIWDYKSDDH